jgi:gliding motility-associated-like protein
MHLIKTIVIIGLLLPQLTFSQRGKNGVKTVSTTEVVNEYNYLTASVGIGSTTITVQNSSLNANSRFSSTLQTGDLLFIYNIQGVEINGIADPGRLEIGWPNDDSWGNITSYRNCGQYEFVEVRNVINGIQIELTCGLTFNHTVGDFNEKVLVVRVPRYQSLTINAGGELTCDPWNGQIGGAVVIEVEGLTSINGTIDVSEKGFRGGQLVNDLGTNYEAVRTGDKVQFGGQKGEGIAGYQTEYNIFGGGFARGAAANAGGAGNSHNGGGAGGANASKSNLIWTGKGIPLTTITTWANAWNIEQAGLASMSSSGGGRGGYCLSNNDGNALTQGPANAVWGGHNRANFGGLGGRPLDYSTRRIFLGGAGGAGHQNDDQGGAGGNGGGLIFLSTYNDIIGTGQLLANGQNGSGSEGLTVPFSGTANKDGSGGGGAGGAILVKTVTTVSGVSFNTKGGIGGNQVLTVGPFGGNKIEAQGPGGGGSGGYIGISNLGLTSNLEGGVNGTTNSDGLTEFPPNGATKGDTGLVAQINNNVNFYADNDTLCGGGSVTITPTITGVITSGQLNWYNSYTSSTVVFNGNSFTTPVLNATTTYYFGACGIPFRDSVTIFASPIIVIDTNSMALQHETCAGNDGSITGITTTGGFGTLKYYWNNSLHTSLDTLNLSGGTFNLIVTDSIGCSDTVNGITVNSSGIPTIDTSFMSFVKDSCNNNTGEINGIFISGGSGSYFSTINGSGVPTLNANSLDSGSYELIVTDNNTGCEDTIHVNIQSVSAPTVFLGNDTTICTGQTLMLDLTTSGATYLWKGGTTNATLVIDSADTYFIEVNVGSCSATDTIQVLFTNGQSVFLGNDTTLCANQILLLDATSPGATYQWQDASINPTYTVTSAGQYHVKTNASGCINRDTINVIFSLSALNIGNDTSICNNDTLVLNATSTGATYLWSDGSTDSTLKVFATNTYWVQVTQGGCSTNDTINVIQITTPIINFRADTILCDNQTFSLDVTNAGATYQWQDASINPIFNVTSTGQYYVKVNISGCSASDTINVAYNNILAVNLGNDTTLCDNATLNLDATNTLATYLWQDGLTNPVYTVSNDGMFWAQVTQGNCTESDSINVVYNYSPTVNLGNDTLICDREELYLDATTPGASYLWYDGATIPNQIFYEAGFYYVRVTSFCGTSSDTINLAVENCDCAIFLPNSFTPNGDGLNDTWSMPNVCEFYQFELRIFNRRGRPIYHTEDPNFVWTGKYNGGVNEAAVYPYNVKYRVVGEDVEIHYKSGHVTMVR